MTFGYVAAKHIADTADTDHSSSDSPIRHSISTEVSE